MKYLIAPSQSTDLSDKDMITNKYLICDKYFICNRFFIGDMLYWRSQSIGKHGDAAENLTPEELCLGGI